MSIWCSHEWEDCECLERPLALGSSSQRDEDVDGTCDNPSSEHRKYTHKWGIYCKNWKPLL